MHLLRLADPLLRLADGEHATHRLALVLALPLLDGVFIALVLAGILNSLSGVFLAGVVILAGSATMAVVLAESGNGGIDRRAILAIGALLIPLAAIQAALAPSLALILDIELLQWVAVGVLALVALDLAAPWLRSSLPRPWVLIGIGLIVSIRPNGGLSLVVDMGLFVRGGLAAGIAIAAVLLLVSAEPLIRNRLDSARLRVGGAGSLLILAVTIVTELPEMLALLILVMAVLLSIKQYDSSHDSHDERFASSM